MDAPISNPIFVKPPKYTGYTEDWVVYEGLMHSCLSQNGCGEVLVERTTPIMVMTMAERASFDRTDATEVARYRYSLIQDKAVGILQQSIGNYQKKKQKYATALVRSTQNSDYPGGLFVEAWKKLKEYHEGIEQGQIIDYENKYFSYQFKDDFRPDHAIMKFDDLR